MDIKSKERIMVAITAALVVLALGALIQMDRTHGGFGSRIGADEVNVMVSKNSGHVTIPSLPQDLLMFGADQEVKLDFRIENKDEDNDIDTIFITVPDGTANNGTVAWNVPALVHEWSFEATSDTEAKFEAKDDLPGRIFGNSSQYNVAGNIDDALDYSTEPSVVEGVTITLEFTTPSLPGAKSGAKGIGLEVADLKTEAPGSPRTSVEDFPYPFVVLDEDYEFIVFELRSDVSTLEIVYGTSTLFAGTRATDIESTPYGFKYTSGDDEIVVLDAPAEGTIVKPLVRATQAETSETFSINMWKYRTLTIDQTVPKQQWLELLTSESSYTDQVPANISAPLDLDLDGDMVFNKRDTDRDGDGIPNNEDTSPDDPNIANRNPVVSRVYPDTSPISEDELLVLHVESSDPDNDQRTFTWTLDSDTSWTAYGDRVEVRNLKAGTYTFRVTAADSKGGSATGSVTITVNEKKDTGNGPNWFFYGLIGLIVVVILIGVVFFVMRGKDEEEEPTLISPAVPDGLTEEEIAEAGEADIEPLGGSTPPSIEEDGAMEEEETVEAPVPSTPAVPPAAPDGKGPSDVQDLEQLIDEMEKTEEEIGDICPECSSPLGPYDTECPTCGAQFEIALECPNCGAVVEDNAGKCPSCGVAFH